MTAKPASPKGRAARGAGGEPRDEQLVAIAAALFAEKGYEGTSLREIADAAGMTKAALYYWFPEKERLFERVVAGRMSMLMERALAAVGDATSHIEKIRRFLVASVEQMDENRFSWMASSNTFWSNFNVDHRKAVVPYRDQYERQLRRYITDAVEQGELRPIDPAIATRLLLSGLNFLPRWHKKEGPLSAAQVMEQYLDIALEGMRPR